ncbi:hypothetical protein NTCA1_49640 [Novosphingobium sp. TCA1]|nr:hypothetical protein NTCA1_49640 [Novosphingobium sp. TCA1]
MSHCTEVSGKGACGKAATIRQDMQGRVRKMGAGGLNQFDEACTQESGLTAGEPDFLRSAIHEGQGFQNLIHDPAIIDGARGL